MAVEKNRRRKVKTENLQTGDIDNNDINRGPVDGCEDTKRTCITHLVECTCILPQYINHEKPVFHKFPVFSIIDNDVVVEKYAQCTFCGVIHHVTDICRSEIVYGKEDSNNVLTKDDIALTLPEKLVKLLNDYDCGVHTWEHVQFILNEKRWGEHVILTRDVIDGRLSGKFLTIFGEDKYGLSTYDEHVDIEL